MLNPSGVAICVAAISRASVSVIAVGIAAAASATGALKFGSCSGSWFATDANTASSSAWYSA